MADRNMRQESVSYGSRLQGRRGLLWAVMALAAWLFAVPLSARAGEAGTLHQVVPNEKREMGNDRYRLLLDEETLGITVTDRASGESWESVQDYAEGNDIWKGMCNSGITVEFYQDGSTIPVSVSTYNEKPKAEIQYYDDGFDADLHYEAYGFRMQLQVRMEGDGLSVFVPGESIEEGQEYLLGAVWLYPMLGAALPGEEEGYMVIPEGVGAIIDMADNHGKFKTPYTKRIYGGNVGIDPISSNRYNVPVVTEPQTVSLPVWGMVYTEKQRGFLGIITDGGYNAQLVAYPNGVTTPYNWVTAKFLVREIYTRQTARSSGVPAVEDKGDIRDLGVRYLFVDGGEADYAGLAKAYQEYLVEQGTLGRQEDRFRIKLDFLGADSKKWFIFNQLVPMTTLEDMDGILEELEGQGVQDILPVYLGWQRDGITRASGSGDFRIESGLGSSRELEGLMEKWAGKGNGIVLQQDFLLASTDRLYNTSTDIVKSVSQTLVEMPTNQKLFKTMYYMTPGRTAELMERFTQQYADTALQQAGIEGVTDNLYSYYSSGVTYTRGECAMQQKEAIGRLGFERIGMTSPNVYLWEDMAEYYAMPMTTSKYNMIAREVPFLPMVLRGHVPYWASYTNFEANEKEFFLKLLEYGAYPAFLLTKEPPVELRNTNSAYIYTSQFSVLEEKILRYDREIGEILRQVEGAGITGHAYLTDQVVMVEYENGISLVVNYGDGDYVYQGESIPSYSYSLVQ